MDIIKTLTFPDTRVQMLKDAIDNDPEGPAGENYEEKLESVLNKLLGDYVKNINANVNISLLNSQFLKDKENARNVELPGDFLVIS
jgi:hypothetical protein